MDDAVMLHSSIVTYQRPCEAVLPPVLVLTVVAPAVPLVVVASAVMQFWGAGLIMICCGIGSRWIGRLGTNQLGTFVRPEPSIDLLIGSSVCWFDKTI
jgi:hypothetical protein